VPDVKQCAILYVTPHGDGTQVAALKGLGFHVDQGEDVPAAEVLSAYHAVIVRADVGARLPIIAARLRATRHFGRRVLVALVPEAMADRVKREAIHSGFDQTMLDTCGVRDLAATILRLLRPYPEFRCILRAPGGRRKAA
jgi:hypothetical protein